MSKFIAADAKPIGAAVRLGDLRTSDVVVEADVYSYLVCGWTGGNIISAENCRNNPRAAAAIDRLKADLRKQAATAGALSVEDVRCFGRNSCAQGLRVWCEGIAYAPLDVCPAYSRR